MSQNFAQVVEAVKELSLAEKEELQELLRKYAIEERRQELLEDLEASLQEWREGKLTFSAISTPSNKISPMIEISFSTSFREAFKRKVRGNPTLEERFWERVEIFENNPFDPRLRTHKLTGSMRDWWSFSIDYDLRVLFVFVEPGRAVFGNIGTH